MNYKTITYKRVKNLGNYQSEFLELSAELNVDDDIEEAAIKLRSKVIYLLALPPDTPNIQPSTPLSDF